ncbi:phosphorylase b kinase regulatory subunit alpha, liver isoform-like isoform X3 [Ptychodera flava]|uniref:phosphorylase b kinase regulatory subunit alpha, liver isoform-like isoform X3 n=1 Tax=Ptychodera flava TaxID=63121 RepID=UPI00396A21F4
MRSRSNSGVRLDYYMRIIQKVILSNQDPISGLLPASNELRDAWVRDNVYSILAVWGLALAYRKHADLDEDRAKAFELEQSVVKLMRGLLSAMMKQVDKVEAFKYSQNPKDALHAKYSIHTGDTVVGDYEWGHLQIDATSFYLLMLAQMTASGLQIIFTLDEVDFIQNMVFYIESAYRIADFGVWERGDKTNKGIPELNASSIGMAKAALEALSDLNLFGARGGPASVIHVLPDETAKCAAVLISMLPRESKSKEVDASLLSIISFPAFAVDDMDKVNITRMTILDKLQGRYGCCRFLRDGYKTIKEDPCRLYYEPYELKVFENIECEWPVFWCYLLIDGIFHNNKAMASEYREALNDILLTTEDGHKVVPELYYVPADKVDAEYRDPHSQERLPGGKIPQMWGTSLYIVSSLLQESFLQVGELDPLNRRYCTEPKPDLVVQVAILAEDCIVQQAMLKQDLHLQTISQVAPIQVHPARVLSHLYSQLGKNKRMGLSGRPSHDIGLLSTSKLYVLRDQVFVFTPQFLDQHQFYLALDNDLLVDMFKTDLAYLRYNWNELGRPTLTMTITHSMLDKEMNLQAAVLATIRKLQTGYTNGVRVKMGKLQDFISTSCFCRLTFLEGSAEDRDEHVFTVENLIQCGDEISRYLESLLFPTCPKPNLPTLDRSDSVSDTSPRPHVRERRKSSVHGIIQRTRSVHIELAETTDIKIPTPGSWSPTQSPRLRRRISTAAPSPEMDRQDRPSWSDDKSVLDMYKGVEASELVEQLRDTTSLTDQADIVHYLFCTKGAKWDTEITGEPGSTVESLLIELYYKAGHMKHWSIVRHTAGMLGKRVEDLAQAATDLIVRQKQLTVGMPPEPREKVITAPLPPDQLKKIIYDACGEDSSTAVLTQEILFYLAAFIKTEPELFHEMLRLRVGLIIQVMASELARTLECSGEEAYEHLMNLSPYEMKCLLHHILSGKEFGVTSTPADGIRRLDSSPGMFRRLDSSPGICLRLDSSPLMFGRLDSSPGICLRFDSSPVHPNISSGKVRQLSVFGLPKEEVTGIAKLKEEVKTRRHSVISPMSPPGSDSIEKLEEAMHSDRTGQWLRRRRLDGALNRVPVGFYEKLWKVLEKCQGLSVEGHMLWQGMTSEMTAGEFKFALSVETVLNRIPQPEYRQLMVETLMVLSLIIENDFATNLGGVITIERLVYEANELFLKQQAIDDGDATLCCVRKDPHFAKPSVLKCGGTAGICQHFYDSAPSGRYGTMTYIAKAVANTLHFPEQNNDCVIS